MKNKKLKSKLNFLLLALITALVLYFSLKDNFNVIIHEILSIHVGWLFLAFVLIFSYWLFRSLVVLNCVRHFKKDYSFKEAVRLTMATQFFNAVTPFSSGGQPFQVYLLTKKGVKATSGTNIVVCEFISYQIPLVLLGVIAIVTNFFYPLFPKDSLLTQLVTVGFIINLGVIILLLAVSFAKGFNKWLVKAGIRILDKIKLVKNKEETLNKWDEHLNNYHQGAKTVFKNKLIFFKMILFNLLGLIVLYLIPWTLFQGVGISINPYICVITSAYVMLIGAFVPIPGGTGGLEFGFIAFFGNFVTGSVLNAVMLLWRFITYYFGMMIGAIAVSTTKGDKK